MSNYAKCLRFMNFQNASFLEHPVQRYWIPNVCLVYLLKWGANMYHCACNYTCFNDHQVGNLPVTSVQAHHLDPVLHQAAHEVLFKLALKVQMTVRPENKCWRFNIMRYGPAEIKSGGRLLGSHSILSNHLPGLLLEPVLVSQEQQAHLQGIFLGAVVLLQLGTW